MNVVIDFTTMTNFSDFTKKCIKEVGVTHQKLYTFQKVNERTYQKNKAIDRHYVVKLNSDLVREKKEF